MPYGSFSMLDGPGGTLPGPSSIENNEHGIEKLLLKTQANEKFWHSEVNLIIQY